MVPTFTCGLVRSNFFFAISFFRPFAESPPRGSNPRPRPYQGRALPTELGGQSSFFPDTKRELLGATPSSRSDLFHYPPESRRGQERAEKRSPALSLVRDPDS